MMLRQIPWRADVVLLIAPTLLCSLHAICVARLSGGTAWLHVQDFEVDVAFQLGHFASVRLRQFAELLEGFLMRKFDRVSAISDRMVERLSEKGVNTNRRALFPNWVDTATIFPMSAPSRMRRELAIPDQAVVLLYSGSMGTKHGLELLADASRRLASRADIRFVFCGEGPYREALVRLSEESRNVIVLPLQPDDRLNELLNVADIHVLPQLASAADLVMPSKLTGMMASGRPVVATARVGTQISRALEGSGIITPPGDVDAFVCAVIRLAADHDLRRRMGEKARQYAVTYMSRDEILREFELSMMIACGRCQEGPPGLSKYENRSLVARELAMSSTKRDDDGPLK